MNEDTRRDQALRLAALELAVKEGGAMFPSAVLDRAQKYFEFIKSGNVEDGLLYKEEAHFQNNLDRYEAIRLNAAE